MEEIFLTPRLECRKNKVLTKNKQKNPQHIASVLRY